DNEWYESGGSRLVLIERVVEVTMRNPITGLGPAAYRPYAATEPLAYGRIIWAVPMINSHNNFIDLFSHVGFVGLGLFLWFAVEVVRNALCLRGKFKTGFQAAFVNGMLATWIGALVIMLLADWILPFVYNIGFEGFPASVLLWLFLGGIVALEQLLPDISGEITQETS
ncbi:MAG: O-antigen ligase family protein, partial [Anaerolineae bacterium]|nr:O-antigen ligase family protein [Anaerolineae bacterium]